MPSDSPDILRFDPDDQQLPQGLPLPPVDGGEVVLLLADPATRESGWGPRVAAALGRLWAREGRNVFLMDGDPVEPALHGLLGQENGEGVTDAVLYGVSPTRMARRLDDGVLFAPAGTVAADPSSVFRHPRWSSVLGACRESGSVVVLYLPAGVPGTDHLAGEGDRVLRLRQEPPGAGEAEPGVTVLCPGSKVPAGAASSGRGASPPAVSSPSPSDAAAWTAAGGEASPKGELAGEPAAAGAGGHGASGATRATGSTGANGQAPAGAARASSSAKAPAKTGSKRGKEGKGGARAGFGPRVVKRRRGPWLVLVLVVLVAGALAAAWLGYIDIPGIPSSAAAPSPLDAFASAP